MRVDFVVDAYVPPPPPPRPPPQQNQSSHSQDQNQQQHQYQQENSQQLLQQPEHLRRVKSSSALSQQSLPKDESRWKAALGEATYFAGGLISHPAESNKHFTVIRHSHALVWYRGPSTCLPITVLSDAPLPATRTLWMQQKGYSGNMGMSLKTLMGSGTDGWINVTPATRAAVEHIPANDERGIQRDLKRFAKTAASSSKLRNHVPRETHMVRIPAAAEDGYFRLVMCEGAEPGKKVLVGSPVFRLASTSTDASVVRGASLSTMPMEMGIRVASTVANTVVKKYTGVAGAVVDSGRKRLTPGNLVVKAAATRAYQQSGLQDKVKESWQKGSKDGGRYDRIIRESMYKPVAVIGDDEAGPEAPFPVPFSGRVVAGSGISGAEFGVPTANLADVSDESVKMRMPGVFAAWARVVPRPGLDGVSHAWHEAIVTVAPLRHATPGVVRKNKVAVHLLHDFAGATFLDAQVKVMLMGVLRASPCSSHHSSSSSSSDHKDEAAAATADDHDEDEAIMMAHAENVMTTVTSLGRDAWAAEVTEERIRAERGTRTWGERLEDGVRSVQARVDRLPLHVVGVRSETGLARDQALGVGGLWVPR